MNVAGKHMHPKQENMVDVGTKNQVFEMFLAKSIPLLEVKFFFDLSCPDWFDGRGEDSKRIHRASPCIVLNNTTWLIPYLEKETTQTSREVKSNRLARKRQ